MAPLERRQRPRVLRMDVSAGTAPPPPSSSTERSVVQNIIFSFLAAASSSSSCVMLLLSLLVAASSSTASAAASYVASTSAGASFHSTAWTGGSSFVKRPRQEGGPRRRARGVPAEFCAAGSSTEPPDACSTAHSPSTQDSGAPPSSRNHHSHQPYQPPPPPRRTEAKRWFPTRIQDALLVSGEDTRSDDAGDLGGSSSHRRDDEDGGSSMQPSSSSYETVVRRLYLRQVVLETRQGADLALDLYQQSMMVHGHDAADSDAPSGDDDDEEAAASAALARRMDPFGHVARLLSVDVATAASGGTVGWVDVRRASSPDIADNGDAPSNGNGSISPACIKQVLAHRPKAGDVCVVQDPSTKQWHVVLVAELWLQPSFVTTTTTTRPGSSPSSRSGAKDVEPAVVGAFRGQNVVVPRENRRFKGRGVRPEFPDGLYTYTIQTAGCQMNVADSERLAGILEHDLSLKPLDDYSSSKNGIGEETDGLVRNAVPQNARTDASWPDVLVLNTCSIRDKAEQKVYNALGPYCAAKRQGQRTVIVVTGCVAQQEGQDLLTRIPEVDAVLGPQYIPFLKNVIDLVATGQQVVATSPMMIAEQDMNVPPVRGHDVRAWVNVIYGCNEHCTYCVVPATRGTEQSRTMEAILAECLDLASRGYKEITLIGQNIDAYGRDMVPRRTFADLLYFLNGRLPSPMRIRYVTSHPRYFGQRVIDAVASLDKVCECFHMPFQAGDDDVLKRMRRGYTYDSYLRIIRRIREKSPDASITTDIIVGFPGESEEAFQKTLQLMQAVKFDNVNSFAYSPRPNTEAALWTEQMLPNDVVAERLQRVQKLAAQHGLERSVRYVGRTEEVLVEDANPRNPLQVMGRTRQGRQVYFDGDLGVLRGQFVRVRIAEARTWSLVGEQVEYLYE